MWLFIFGKIYVVLADYLPLLLAKNTTGLSVKNWPVKRSLYSDSFWAGRSGDRIPVWERFTASAHTDRGAHPASYTKVRRSGRGVDNPPPSSAKVEGRVEVYISSTSGPL